MKLIFHRLPCVDSTNPYAKHHAQQFDAAQMTCVHADEQTAGRGRFGRKWHSPKGNIYATFVFWLPKETKDLGALAELMAVSLAEVLFRKSLQPTIKWPNDVRLSGKKLAGILCETVFEEERVACFLGIGVNVSATQKELAEIDQNATSLHVETGQSWDPDPFLQELSEQFLRNFKLFRASGFAPFYKTVEALLAYWNEEVIFFDGAKEIRGICRTVAPDGRLILELPDGTLQTFAAGDLSSRK